MKLTIIAATGGIGRELLQQAVAAGHDVTVVVRNPAKLSGPVRAITTERLQHGRGLIHEEEEAGRIGATDLS